MAGTVTDARIAADTALGLDWQSSEGQSVPGTPFMPRQFIVCQSIERDPDPSYIKPDGTHGGMHRRKEGTRISTQAFKKTLTLFASKHQLCPFLESVMSAQPVSNNADVTESGDASGVASGYTLTGIRPYHNSSKLQLNPFQPVRVYLDMEAAAGPAFPVTVKAYRHADLDPDDLVASGTAGGAGVLTLQPVNNSNLTITLTLTGAATQVVTLTIDKINYSFSKLYSRYFRLYYTDGNEVVVLSDCAVESIEFESSESGELLATVSVLAKRRDIEAGASLTVPRNNLDLVTYSHSELSIVRDPAGDNTKPVVDSFTFQIGNNVLQYIGNAPTPQKIIKRGWTDISGSLEGEMSDEMAKLIKDARDNTAPAGGLKDWDVDYTLLNKALKFSMKNVRVMLAEPGFDGEEYGKAALDFEAHADEANDPLSVSLQL